MSQKILVSFLFLLFTCLFHAEKVASLISCVILSTELSVRVNLTTNQELLSGGIKWLENEHSLSDIKDILVIATVFSQSSKVWHHHRNIIDHVLKPLRKGSLNQELSFLRSFTELPLQTYCILPFSLREYVNKTECTWKEDCMNYEWGRYESFKKFPMDSPATPMRLASSGFFYTGSSDIVKCFSCHMEYSSWKDGDEPNAIHRLLSPYCDFVKGVDSKNVPIHQSAVPDGNSFQTDSCTGGANWTETIGAEGNSTNLILQKQSSQVRSTYEHKPTSVRTINHKFPGYEQFQNRLLSFDGWTNLDVIEPRTLASAGFFFAGFNDCVRCFSCGGGLRNWEYGDSPMEEHAKWFPWCRFLREEKETDFVTQHQTESTVGLPRTEVISEFDEVKTHEDQNFSRQSFNHKTDERENKYKAITSEVKEKLNEMGLSYSSDQIRKLISRFIDIGQSLTTEFIITQLVEDQETLENSEQVSAKTSEGSNNTNQHNVYKNSDKNENGFGHFQQDPDEFKEENIKLKSQIMCKICMDSHSTIVFIPCGHMVSCEKCATKISKCAVCRLPIKGRVKAFMS